MTYDPAQISYEKILKAFFSMHDPAGDPGDGDGQYRSAVFFHTPEQREALLALKARLEKERKGHLSVQIAEAPTFWQAEDYHQQYLEKQKRH